MNADGPPLDEQEDGHSDDDATGDLETSDLGPSLSPLSPRARAQRLIVSLAAVLLALNVEAHQSVPDLPVADAAEQAIAQRIQSAAGG